MKQDTGRLFIENTKYRNMLPPPQQMGNAQPPFETEKAPGQELIKLPEPDSRFAKPIGLAEAINERRSIREYSGHALTQEELSYLLWCTQGVKTYIPGQATFRTVPSAGARHALDTYLLINKVTGLSNGLYRYMAIEQGLVQISEEPGLAGRIVSDCLDQLMVKSCAVCFIWVAVVERMSWRYGERGFRYLFLDAGHVCQNLYLCAQAVGSGVCAIGAFSDDELNDTLNLDGINRFVIYLACVGRIKGKE
ncbi:MAG: SagB/ThcOx family dehydrogenase [Bacteroidales bacterium]|nr:MAG: SagB/ThcOx family dehydrogenase [Bacteroidales bacterium]